MSDTLDFLGGIIWSTAGVAAGLSALVVTLIQLVMKRQFDASLETHKGQVRKDVELYLEQEKAELRRDVDTAIETHRGEVRKNVEVYLGDRSAEREYELEAKKRLYAAVGPLRFQLSIACRDLTSRIVSHIEHQQYSTNPGGYYGRSFLYRLLRPFTISQLIERQINSTDFSVDPSVVRLLSFSRAAATALTSEEPILSDTRANWNAQEQHVYSQNLTRAAAMLIHSEDGLERFVYVTEFDDIVDDPAKMDELEPFPSLLTNFSSTRKPLLWVRFTCLAYLCNAFMEQEGMDFTKREVDVRAMLKATEDDIVMANLEQYVQRFEAMAKNRL